MRDDRLDPADSDIFDVSAMECGMKGVEEGLSKLREGELQAKWSGRATTACLPAAALCNSSESGSAQLRTLVSSSPVSAHVCEVTSAFRK